MTFGRLLVAALLVTPLVSCGGTAALLIVDAAGRSTPSSGDDFMLGFIMLGMVSFVIVAGAIFLVGIPLALLLDRLGVPSWLRDFLFIAAAGAVTWLRYGSIRMDGTIQGFELAIVGLTVLAWIIAMRVASRGKRPVEQSNE
jgi:hypothetical protein